VLLISWMIGERGREALVELEQPELAAHNRYLLHLIALWFLEFPLASLPATLLIGKQIFFENLTYRQLLAELKPLAWRVVLILGILRAGLLGLLLEPFIDREDTFNPFLEVVLLVIFFCGWAVVRRAAAPYAPEILALEACKLKTKKKNELSYWRRSSSLHNPILGDSIGRLVTCGVVVTALVWILYSVTLVGDFVGLRQTNIDFLNSVLSNRVLLTVALPLTIWAASIYATVFRFLTYLDSRIRLEGWEVELQLKAERTRILAQMNVTPEGEPLEEEVPAL
jgi:hypothetical protein